MPRVPNIGLNMASLITFMSTVLYLSFGDEGEGWPHQVTYYVLVQAE
jgi:hypothetical protein